MKITANLLDPSIVTSTLPPTDRFSSREATPTAPLDLDTPLKRLCKNAMSGQEVISLLQKFSMLPQFQRELILDAELASVSCSQEEMFSAYKTFYRKYQINSDAERDTWLVRNKCTLAQLEHSVLRTLKLDRFKQTTFGHKVESYFLQRKSQLDRVIYSLLRVKDPHLAQELFFRIQDREATFTELVKQYSGGQEADVGGVVGPHELSIPHPVLAQKLRSLQPGQLAPPLQIADWFVVVRLEKFLPAQLDQVVQSRLIDELYEQWLQARLHDLSMSD
ncbi:peptidylprolyl isomerase [Chamaesiphon sp. OTE_75_metabat_556]|uniref:peptidylprolyl isomerase n=1 Tax=Chamaesiphon sp. OTE_75_metabat_556 TaxID=2964692 RepID=UPI00286B0B84|nr:peptidylprolyl isomerase [Chamaesiphon sp. OTE_75_metabat_556]